MINPETYTNPGYQYKFARGPEVVRSHDDARRYGLNCVALAHLVLADLYGELLPPTMHSYEMFTSRSYFSAVPALEHMDVGDLLWFGLARPKETLEGFTPQYDGNELVNWRDHPLRHVGVFTGHHEADDPLVLHATNHTGTVSVWPLSDFNRFPQYARLFGISRFQPAFVLT